MTTEVKIRVRFFTKYEKYRITDAPFAVPSKLGRYGLSEVVNHLLDSSDSPQPFDFAINGHLVRVSLKKFVTLNRISTEDVVTIEYMPAISISDESKSVEVPAWIGCISTKVDGLIVAGCYDGKIQIADSSNLELSTSTVAHSEPIRAVASWATTTQNQSSAFIATASKDHSLKCWSLARVKSKNANETHQLALAANLVGHVNSVECVDYWGVQQMVLSGDWSGNILGFSVKTLGDSDAVETNGRKKQKSDSGATASSSSVREVKSTFTLRAHTQSVCGLQVCGEQSNKLYSCSWDHSLKEWDVERQDCVATYASSKVMTSLHYSEAAHLVATSHPDGKIRLWDARKRDDSQSVGTFSSGKENNWVAQVRWHPSSSNIFASADYDGAVKVWDTRAAIPLGASQAHEGKALCVDWLTGGAKDAQQGEGEGLNIVSGGSDCVLRSTPIATSSSQ